MPPGLRTALLAEAEVRRIGAGEWVYGTGDTPRGVFALLDGAALVYVALPRGDDVLVQIAMPGDVFGHAAQLGHGPRLATVLTARPSTLMYLPESALTRLGRRHPELWAALTQLLYNQYGALLLQFARHLALPARARLAGRLLQLTDFTPSPPVAALPQAQLAELVGVTRKTINALLAELSREGLVNVRRRQVAILQRDALRRIAVGEPA